MDHTIHENLVDLYQYAVFFQAGDLTDLEKEKIHNHFLIRRKSQGGECGPVEKIGNGLYRIPFLEQEAQERVLHVKDHAIHMSSGCELHISLSGYAKFDGDKNLTHSLQSSSLNESENTSDREILQPGNVVVTADHTSVSVTWSKPAGVDVASYHLTLYCEKECLQKSTVKSLQHSFHGLQIGKEYSISVSTVLKKGGRSDAVFRTITTSIPVPERVTVDRVTSTSTELRWNMPQSVDEIPHSFQISYHREGTEPQIIYTDLCSTVISGLIPDTEYNVSVTTVLSDEEKGQPVSALIHTERIPVPEKFTVMSLTEICEHNWEAKLSWSWPNGMNQIHSFQISYHSEGSVLLNKTTNECSAVITGLQPYTRYTASVCTIFEEAHKSPCATLTFYTGEIRLVLLGKTGMGKSSTGNTILEEDVFTVSNRATSVTHECSAKSKTARGRKIKIVDTPGFFDTNLTDKELKSNIAKCITECSPGPHAFILLMRVDRFTKQESETIKKCKDIFGKEALKHTVILFTNGNQLENNETIQGFVESSSGGDSGKGELRLKEFMHECGGRYHVIDNKIWKEKHEGERSNKVQVENLLTTIEQMVSAEGGHYTNDFLMEVEKAIVSEMLKIREKHGNHWENSFVREKARKEVEKRILKHRGLGITIGVLIGALCGPVIAVASAVGLFAGALCAVRDSLRNRNAERTEEREHLINESTGHSMNATGVKAAASAGVGAGATVTSIVAGVAAGVEAASVAAISGVAAGAVLGTSAVVGAVWGGIEGADKIAAIESKNSGEVFGKIAKQTFNKNCETVKKAFYICKRNDS